MDKLSAGTALVPVGVRVDGARAEVAGYRDGWPGKSVVLARAQADYAKTHRVAVVAAHPWAHGAALATGGGAFASAAVGGLALSAGNVKLGVVLVVLAGAKIVLAPVFVSLGLKKVNRPVTCDYAAKEIV